MNMIEISQDLFVIITTVVFIMGVCTGVALMAPWKRRVRREITNLERKWS
jgi:heme/copper-type cytochrome/quinol oxidase subunit 2